MPSKVKDLDTINSLLWETGLESQESDENDKIIELDAREEEKIAA